jgi:hypothetical protein
MECPSSGISYIRITVYECTRFRIHLNIHVMASVCDGYLCICIAGLIRMWNHSYTIMRDSYNVSYSVYMNIFTMIIGTKVIASFCLISQQILTLIFITSTSSESRITESVYGSLVNYSRFNGCKVDPITTLGYSHVVPVLGDVVTSRLPGGGFTTHVITSLDTRYVGGR